MDIEKLTWTYEPSGDVDGDPAYDGKAGIDHFVMEGDREIACAPDERRARLIASAPRMLAALKEAEAFLDDHVRRCPATFYGQWAALCRVREAIDGATGEASR